MRTFVEDTVQNFPPERPGRAGMVNEQGTEVDAIDADVVGVEFVETGFPRRSVQLQKFQQGSNGNRIGGIKV
jgi:hypothetical protein